MLVSAGLQVVSLIVCSSAERQRLPRSPRQRRTARPLAESRRSMPWRTTRQRPECRKDCGLQAHRRSTSPSRQTRRKELDRPSLLRPPILEHLHASAASRSRSLTNLCPFCQERSMIAQVPEGPATLDLAAQQSGAGRGVLLKDAAALAVQHGRQRCGAHERRRYQPPGAAKNIETSAFLLDNFISWHKICSLQRGQKVGALDKSGEAHRRPLATHSGE
jgi:hypothetical protein